MSLVRTEIQHCTQSFPSPKKGSVNIKSVYLDPVARDRERRINVRVSARVGVDLQWAGDGLLTIALLIGRHLHDTGLRARDVHGAERADSTHWRVQALVQYACHDGCRCAAAVVRGVNIRDCVARSERRVIGIVSRARVVGVIFGAHI